MLARIMADMVMATAIGVVMVVVADMTTTAVDAVMVAEIAGMEIMEVIMGIIN
jgi:hypothetical protein